MKVFREGHTEQDVNGGLIGSYTAAFDTAMLAERPALQPLLAAIGQELIAQFREERGDDRVIGVTLQGIEFTVMLGPRPARVDRYVR